MHSRKVREGDGKYTNSWNDKRSEPKATKKKRLQKVPKCKKWKDAGGTRVGKKKGEGPESLAGRAKLCRRRGLNLRLLKIAATRGEENHCLSG